MVDYGFLYIFDLPPSPKHIYDEINVDQLDGLQWKFEWRLMIERNKFTSTAMGENYKIWFWKFGYFFIQSVLISIGNT